MIMGWLACEEGGAMVLTVGAAASDVCGDARPESSCPLCLSGQRGGTPGPHVAGRQG